MCCEENVGEQHNYFGSDEWYKKECQICFTQLKLGTGRVYTSAWKDAAGNDRDLNLQNIDIQ